MCIQLNDNNLHIYSHFLLYITIITYIYYNYLFIVIHRTNTLGLKSDFKAILQYAKIVIAPYE